MNIMVAVNQWVHIMSVVIWVGGLAFVVIILNPALKDTFPKEAVQNLARAIQARYYRLTGVLLALILITGGLNVRFVRHDLLDEGGLSKLWLLTLGIKLFLATGLISIYFLNLLYRNEPHDEDETEIPWARPSLILGVLILLSAAFLKYAHPH